MPMINQGELPAGFAADFLEGAREPESIFSAGRCFADGPFAGIAAGALLGDALICVSLAGASFRGMGTFRPTPHSGHLMTLPLCWPETSNSARHLGQENTIMT